jgi:hypothetical protein
MSATLFDDLQSLTQGALVALVIIAMAGVLLLLAGAVWWLRRSKAPAAAKRHMPAPIDWRRDADIGAGAEGGGGQFSRDFRDLLRQAEQAAAQAPAAAEPLRPDPIAPPAPGSADRPAGGAIPSGSGATAGKAAGQPQPPSPKPATPAPARKKSVSAGPAPVSMDAAEAAEVVAAAIAVGTAATGNGAAAASVMMEEAFGTASDERSQAAAAQAEDVAPDEPAPQAEPAPAAEPLPDARLETGAEARHDAEATPAAAGDEVEAIEPAPAAPPAPAAAPIAPPAPADIADDVTCSVFAPTSAAPGAALMVQVFLHVDADLIKVRELAQEADPEVERRLGFARLRTRIVRGAIVDVELCGRGLVVDEPLQSLVWDGDPEAANFVVSLPRGGDRRDFFPVARLYIDGVPIGHIKFKLSAEPQRATLPYGMSLADTNPRLPRPQGFEERRYRRAFLSYSRQDFEPVSHFNEGLVHAGYETFFDLESLASGQPWSAELEQAIRASDVFFLCWTTAARQSPWVEREARFAYAESQSTIEERPAIIPIAFETPLPPPPDFLAHLHFNSRHQLIRAGMKVAGSR